MDYSNSITVSWWDIPCCPAWESLGFVTWDCVSMQFLGIRSLSWCKPPPDMSASLYHFQHALSLFSGDILDHFLRSVSQLLCTVTPAQIQSLNFHQLISSFFIDFVITLSFHLAMWGVISLLSLVTTFILSHFGWPPIFWDSHHVYFRPVSGDSKVWIVRSYFILLLAAAHFFICSMMFYSKDMFHGISSMWVLKVPVYMWVLKVLVSTWILSLLAHVSSSSMDISKACASTVHSCSRHILLVLVWLWLHKQTISPIYYLHSDSKLILSVYS